jgi:hypothetical protein
LILKKFALVDSLFSLDNYVHRLVASKTDGKIVQYECEGDTCQEEKIDALQLEVRCLVVVIQCLFPLLFTILTEKVI